MIQIIYIAVFTAASQRLQFTNKRKTKYKQNFKRKQKENTIQWKERFLIVSWTYQCLWFVW